MTQKPIPPLIDYFKDIKDPRIERNKAYPLIEVIVITLPAIMAGKISKNTEKPKNPG
jgi:hypothetical protein